MNSSSESKRNNTPSRVNMTNKNKQSDKWSFIFNKTLDVLQSYDTKYLLQKLTLREIYTKLIQYIDLKDLCTYRKPIKETCKNFIQLTLGMLDESLSKMKNNKSARKTPKSISRISNSKTVKNYTINEETTPISRSIPTTTTMSNNLSNTYQSPQKVLKMLRKKESAKKCPKGYLQYAKNRHLCYKYNKNVKTPRGYANAYVNAVNTNEVELDPRQKRCPVGYRKNKKTKKCIRM